MFKVMIVDDERLARVELKRLLDHFDDITVVAEANSAKQALKLIKNQQPDLIFIDIKMPQMSGLELVRELEHKVQFVFCTAFTEHAVDAFELDAVDYLVKPVNPERLAQTIKKFRYIRQDNNDGEQFTSNQYLAANHGLLLKFKDSSKIVRLEEIDRFHVLGNHIEIYSLAGKSYLHSPLSKVATRLDPRVFFKASRSDIIRVDNIDKIEEGMTPGSVLAILKSGEQIEVSRRQAQHLKNFFNF